MRFGIDKVEFSSCAVATLGVAVIQVGAQVMGNHVAITVGGQWGQLDLNTMQPLIARNLLESIHVLASASRALADKTVAGIVANEETCRGSVEISPSMATALTPLIGYDQAAEIAYVGELGVAIEGGSTFSEALAQHPKVFNRLYVNMVKAGELGGVLEVVLARLSEFMEKAQKIKGKVIAAAPHAGRHLPHAG